MNKQELIKRIEVLPYTEGPIADTITINRNWILESIEQLDEPKKIVAPQFVADWYEENKDDFEGNLFRCAHNIPSTFDGAKLNEFERWFLNASIKPFQTLVNMHQFGYEVEKEKRYTVVMKETKQPLYYNAGDKKLFFSLGGLATNFTRKQLEEAGFGWVFDCPGIEVEEVDLCH
jgi:hypothetical protein